MRFWHFSACISKHCLSSCKFCMHCILQCNTHFWWQIHIHPWKYCWCQLIWFIASGISLRRCVHVAYLSVRLHLLTHTMHFIGTGFRHHFGHWGNYGKYVFASAHFSSLSHVKILNIHLIRKIFLQNFISKTCNAYGTRTYKIFWFYSFPN